MAVVDLLMPTMDGFEFAWAVREEPSVAETPIVFFTATYPPESVASRAAACGVLHVLHKSCTTREIADAVADAARVTPRPAAAADFRREHLKLIHTKIYGYINRINCQ